MTQKRTKTAADRKTRKLKVKRETLKDLGASNAAGVKGGTGTPVQRRALTGAACGQKTL